MSVPASSLISSCHISSSSRLSSLRWHRSVFEGLKRQLPPPRGVTAGTHLPPSPETRHLSARVRRSHCCRCLWELLLSAYVWGEEAKKAFRLTPSQYVSMDSVSVCTCIGFQCFIGTTTSLSYPILSLFYILSTIHPRLAAEIIRKKKLFLSSRSFLRNWTDFGSVHFKIY